MNLDRRNFLKLCGACAAMLGVSAKVAPPTVEMGKPNVPSSPRPGYGVLIDSTQCVGCRSCQRACKTANNLPGDGLEICFSATTFTYVDMHNVSQTPTQAVIRPIKRQCMHCEAPACVSVCPVGALEKKENGCVAYDADKCIGCRYCMMACPFGVPQYDWNSPNPKINKCAQGCMANTKSDRPACVQSCPAKALTYGNREELLAIAHDRIAKNPTKYHNQVYGEKEIGGTSMLYLGSVPFEWLGFRTDLPKEPLPSLTWEVQSKIPAVIATALTVLSGIAWWTHRAEKQAQPATATVPVFETPSINRKGMEK